MSQSRLQGKERSPRRGQTHTVYPRSPIGLVRWGSRNGQVFCPSRSLGRMSVPPDERLPASRVASHLGVMAIVAAVMGVVVAGLAIPFAGVLGIGAKSLSHTVEDLPAEPAHPAAGAADPDRRRRGQHHRDALRREPHQRPAEPDLAEDGQVDRRDRGLPLLPARRPRPEGHAARPGHQPGQRRRGPGWLVDHPADGQDDAARPGEDRQGSARPPPPTPTPASSRELRYAIAFEQNYSKDWILERYLNIAYFGDGAYGVQAAARHYFGTNAKDLNLRAGRDARRSGQEPDRLRPDQRNPDRGLERRNVVLDRLAQLHVISQHKADKLKKQPLGLHPVATPERLRQLQRAVLLRLRRPLPRA